MAEILLTSETFIKSVTSINDNVAGKFLLPSLREAQDNGLRPILGDALINKLKRLIEDEQIGAEENAIYHRCVDMCQYYLAYKTITEVAKKVTYKVGNFGVAKSTDENLQVASWDEVSKMEDYYQGKADAYCIDLQNWLLEHKAEIPELSEHHCHRIESNLYSAASCGIFLGGARGKYIRR